jgi:hypothetical protein
MDSNTFLAVAFTAVAFAAAAVALSKAKAKSEIVFGKAASSEELSKVKSQHIKLFFEICEITRFLQGVRNFRNFCYEAKPGILVACTSKHPNLPQVLEKIKSKNLEISEDETETIEEIVMRMIEAACLGLISKSKGALNIDGALAHIKGELEAGYYWSVVAHSMADFSLEFDDKTVDRTFFEQIMLK